MMLTLSRAVTWHGSRVHIVSEVSWKTFGSTDATTWILDARTLCGYQAAWLLHPYETDSPPDWRHVDCIRCAGEAEKWRPYHDELLAERGEQ